MPPFTLAQTRERLLRGGWPEPNVFAARLTNLGLSWPERRKAQDAYEDTLSEVAFVAAHPYRGSFDTVRAVEIGECARKDVGLALYLLEMTDERAALDESDPRGV